MSIEAPNFAPNYDPRSYDVDLSGQPLFSSAEEMLRASRARHVLMNGALTETVDADPSVVGAREHGLSQLALDKVGYLALGATEEAEGVIQLLLGAETLTNTRQSVRLPDLQSEFALAA